MSRCRFAIILLFVCLPLSAAPRARAQATLISGLGGTAGYGTSCLGMNDDGSSNAISITPYFPGGLHFFTGTHTQLFVNTNGNITFNGPVSTYTGSAFPFPVTTMSQPMIAPFWADVDTRTPATLFGLPFGCNGPGDGVAVMGPACDNPSQDGVWWYFEAGPPARAIFTWDRVGYYQCHLDHRMSFQLILTAATGGCGSGVSGTDFDIEFRYNRCEWETGDASGGTGGFGGTAAQAGFDAGNGMDFVEIPGSRVAGIAAHLCTGSNVMPAQPGIWRFLVRGGVVMCPDAGMPCTVAGAMGVCANGRMNCVGSGTACQQQVMPSAERCNALDDDCDGMVDEMTGTTSLCPATQMCVSGSCVDACFEGGCGAGFTCTPSGCVEAACVGVTCPASQRCSGGTCVDACGGVVCPHGLTCIGGSCVDVCATLTCDTCTVCSGGACVPSCAYAPCSAGRTCQADGHCVETACAGVTCPAGNYCSGGSCQDSCAGAVCPAGQMCAIGACVPAVGVDAGPPPVSDGGGIITNPDGGGGGPVDVDGGTDGGPSRRTTRAGGCCTVAPGAERGGSRALAVLVAGLALALLRRRR